MNKSPQSDLMMNSNLGSGKETTNLKLTRTQGRQCTLNISYQVFISYLVWHLFPVNLEKGPPPRERTSAPEDERAKGMWDKKELTPGSWGFVLPAILRPCAHSENSTVVNGQLVYMYKGQPSLRKQTLCTPKPSWMCHLLIYSMSKEEFKVSMSWVSMSTIGLNYKRISVDY